MSHLTSDADGKRIVFPFTPELVSTFRVDAKARVERLSEAWGKLMEGPEDSVAAELHHDLHTLKGEARLLGLTDLTLLTSKLEDVVFLAHRREYDLPPEMFLTVSMGMELLGFLVSALGGGDAHVDLAGFVEQLDAVVRDARTLASKEVRERPARAPRSTSNEAGTSDAGSDRLGRATRQRLAAVATSIYLDSLRLEGAAGLRLRESWTALRDEIAQLGCVSLRARLLRHVDGLTRAAAECDKSVAIDANVEDVTVSPEAAAILNTAAVHLLNNAVAHGIETVAERVRAGKPRMGNLRLGVRVADGAAILVVEDDGAGIDVEAVTRAAIVNGVLPEGSAPVDRQAQTLIFEKGITTATATTLRHGDLAGRGVGLDAVRQAVKAGGGSIDVRSVAGRGTAMTVTLPGAATNVAVRTFRWPTGRLLLAVEASWSVGTGSGVPLDPVAALGLKATVRPLDTVVFRRERHAFEIPVQSTPVLGVAARVCPTSPDAPAEVVLVGATEAILLRLDVIAKRASQSTVPPPNSNDATSSEKPDGIQPRKILLLDDNVTWLVLTRSALLRRGFDVYAVSSLTEFADALLRWGPDIVLADVQMPEITAGELCRRVKAVRPLVPVILISDAPTSDADELVAVANADGVLSKLSGPDALAAQLSERGGGDTTV